MDENFTCKTFLKYVPVTYPSPGASPPYTSKAAPLPEAEALQWRSETFRYKDARFPVFRYRKLSTIHNAWGEKL